MNHFTFTGRLGKDAEQSFTQSGTAMLKFSVANNTGYGETKKTNWFRCVLFGKKAEGGLKGYLVKGQEVAILGELTINDWTDDNGTKRTSVDVFVKDLDLIGGKPEREPTPADYTADDANDAATGGDVPF